ncbi:MAG: class I SAM-dependent methyltransferase [Patescibacteria group bacterium]
MAVPYDFYNYPKFWQGREYEDEAEKIALKKFFLKIPKKDSLIDIGGGFGRLAEVYAPVFKHSLLVDPSEKLLNIAQKNLKKFKNIEFRKGRGERLPGQDGSFDVALMIRVVHHLQNPQKVFLEASRVLKPNGFLILEFANKIHFRARLRAWIRGDFGFTSNLEPSDQRSLESIAASTIPFLNHHPQFIYRELEKAGFKVSSSLSVSNFRHPLVKKIIPLPILLFLEKYFSLLSSHFSPFFGPSIFVLCQKT